MLIRQFHLLFDDVMFETEFHWSHDYMIWKTWNSTVVSVKDLFCWDTYSLPTFQETILTCRMINFNGWSWRRWCWWRRQRRILLLTQPSVIFRMIREPRRAWSGHPWSHRLQESLCVLPQQQEIKHSSGLHTRHEGKQWMKRSVSWPPNPDSSSQSSKG